MTFAVSMTVEIEGVTDIELDDLADAVKAMKGILEERYDHYRDVRVAINRAGGSE